MGKKSSGSAPAIDPRVGEAMEKQAAVLERQQAWYENEIYPWMVQQANLQNEYANQDRQIAQQNYQYWQNLATEQYKKQNDLADYYFDRYKNDIKPVEDALIADAKRYNTSAEAERQAGLAIGDVATSAAAQRQANNMQMQAYGINPTAGAYQSQANASVLNQAALQASAANQARSAAEQLGWTKKAQVAALGQQYIGNSNQATALGTNATSTYGNAASGALGQSASYGQVGLNNLGALANVGLNSYQALSNGWGNYGNAALNASNYNLNAWNAQTQNQTNRYNSFWNNLGTASNILDTWTGPSAYQRIGQGTQGFASAAGKF